MNTLYTKRKKVVHISLQIKRYMSDNTIGKKIYFKSFKSPFPHLKSTKKVQHEL